MDYIQQGFDNAMAADTTADAVKQMGYDAIHTLCGKDKNSVDEIFVWESVRSAIADMIENYTPELEAENGEII